MNYEQYVSMCEQMGWEVDESQIPKDPSSFSLEVQQALLLFNVLPDLVEGMSGTWLGKNYSGIGDILDIYQIQNKYRSYEDWSKYIEIYKMHLPNEKYIYTGPADY